jgi:flagellar biosynthesis protein FlhG
MKGIEEQTYYEILEVSPVASVQEIEQAYERAKATYEPESVAVYSLFTEPEVKRIRDAVEDAYRVLKNQSSRQGYDRTRVQTIDEQSAEAASMMETSSKEPTGSLSFTEIAFKPVDEPYRGQTLKQIREGMGIDLKTISGETKISIKMIEWIEDEVVERLPAMVYLKGFLKMYARSLGLDGQKVIEGYLSFLNKGRKK